MEGLTFLDKFTKEDIESIGLVFEPNFFTAYFYADAHAKNLTAYKTFNSWVSLQSQEIKELKPLFALSFKGPYTLVPQQVFKEEEAGIYLEFNTSATGKKVEWERLIGLESIMIYEPDSESEAMLAEAFPGLRLKHGIGSLLELCRQNEKKETEVFLNQTGKNFDLAVFKNQKLIFANTVKANHAEDLRYFVLFTLKTLQINTETPLNLLGKAVNNTEIINLLQEYLPHINRKPIFDLTKANIKNPTGLDFPFISTHWPGIYASICAL